MEGPSSPANPGQLRRSAPGPWRRFAGRALAYGVLLPLTYLLRVFGLWPSLLNKAQARAEITFGTYRPSVHDVIVAAFHKSGTNWTMQMAVQIAHFGKAEFDHIHDIVPWPDSLVDPAYSIDPHDMSAVAASPTGLRIVKTHLPLGNVPYVPSAKYICVVRDPKDVLVSSFFFLRSVILGPLMPSLAEWKELTVAAGAVKGDWAEHLQSFWRVRDLENVLFLTFEDIKADPAAAIDGIAALMGVELSAEQHALVLEKSSFDYMREIGAKFDPVGIAMPWTNAAGSMMRRGKPGDSAEYLSKPERDAIDKHWRLRLEALGSDFPYDAHFASEPVTG